MSKLNSPFTSLRNESTESSAADFEADADADQHLRPRIFAAPPDGGGAAALPGYADLVASSAAPYGRQVAAY